MSSFKRRTGGPTNVTNQGSNATPRPNLPTLPKGTKLSPHHAQLLLTSTGMSSLDGVIGGGLPIGTVGLVLSDRRTNYSKMAMNYYIGEGVLQGHGVVLCSGEGEKEKLEEWARGIPGPYEVPGKTQDTKEKEKPVAIKPSSKEEELTIAWRYKELPKLNSAPVASTTYCHSFDLSKTMKKETWENIDLHTLSLNSPDFTPLSPHQVLNKIKDIIEQGGYSARTVTAGGLGQRKILRIAIEAMGSPSWTKGIYSFLHGLKGLLRYSFATALITFPAHLYPPSFSRAVMTLSDLAIEFHSFADFPDSQSSEYHGMFYLHKTPQVNSLLNVGLRPTSSSGPGRTGAGGSTSTNATVNDLGFKLRRKRLVIETFHLPIEGGVGDRRTEPPPSTSTTPATPKTPSDPSAPRKFTASHRPPPEKRSPLDF